MNNVEISRVEGRVDANGTLVRIEIEGSAPGRDELVAEVLCAAGPFVTPVPVVDDQFLLVIGSEEVKAFECFCRGRIVVRLREEDGEELAAWEGEVVCLPSESPEPDNGQGCVVEPGALVGCGVPEVSAGPQHTLYFHQAVPLDDLAVADQIDVQRPNPQVGPIAVPTKNLELQLATLLRFEQRWFFREFLVSDLAGTISLAPHESLRLVMRNTQRKRLTQNTLNSVEELDSRESTLIDRDVLNVARSMSSTENWRVDGTGSFSIGGLSLGMSGGYNKTVNRAVQSTNQRLKESTTKSASTLKALQKTEISEVSEETEERLTSRTLINPYFDRSLLIKVFDQTKVYCVETELVHLAPALIVKLDSFPFDRRFVLRFRDFLSEALLDTALDFELGEALEAASELRDEAEVQRAVEVAELALQYLFEKPPSIFNMPDIPGPFQGPDPDDPANSFNAQLFRSGLGDANDNDLGVIFTALGYYFRIYIDRVSGQANVPSDTALDDLFAVDLAVSLARFVTPLWKGFEDTGKISNVLDGNDQTEVLRRLSGFLSLVSGVLTPLVAPVEELRENEVKIRRAEHVIARAVDHLQDNAGYYTQAFFEYLQATARHDLLAEFVNGAVAATTLGTPQDLIAELDIDAAYIDGSRLIVPAQFDKTASDFVDFSEQMNPPDDEPLDIGEVSVTSVEVPCEGVYLEAIGGRCVLAEVPARSTTVIEASGWPEDPSSLMTFVTSE